jgi:hypothetical protein
MNTPQTLTNLAQQIYTPTGITRVAAGLLALPAVMVTPWLLICNHPVPSCAAVANLVSVGTALKTGDPVCLIPALGITGGIFGYSIYRSLTDNPDDCRCKNKKPSRVALEIETYIRPH